MLVRIRNWFYFLYVLGFAILGVAESTVVKSSVMLFENLPIPAFNKYILPAITIAVFLLWGTWILFRLGHAAEAEDEDNFDKAREISTRIVLESPTVCVLFSLVGITMLEDIQASLISWDFARSVYSYGILWLVITPCLLTILEFIQGIDGFPEFNKENNDYLKNSQAIDGFISSVFTCAAAFLLIIIGNMTVCKYIYYIYIALLIYRLLRYYHISSTLWVEAPAREIDDIDKKEGIL